MSAALYNAHLDRRRSEFRIVDQRGLDLGGGLSVLNGREIDSRAARAQETRRNDNHYHAGKPGTAVTLVGRAHWLQYNDVHAAQASLTDAERRSRLRD